MDKVVVTSFTIIAAIVCAVVLFQAVYPAVFRGSSAMASVQDRVGERLRSDVGIIHTAGELDNLQMWQDTNGNGLFDIFIWAKNLGELRVDAIESCDLFLGPEGNFQRIPHQSAAGGSYPYWTYALENSTSWDPTCTLKITVHYATVLSSERYYAKLVLPNGVSDALFFGL